MKPCDNILQIQRFSVNDGEGIRSTVFFKGCRLRCRWCANPESWSWTPQIMFYAHKCTSCGRCAAVCPSGATQTDAFGRIHYSSALCATCGTCLKSCPHKARVLLGHPLTVEEVLAEIKKDLVFYEESGGGVTFSGGEPFLHPVYLRQLLDACAAWGISTAAESCGCFDWEECSDLIPRLDQLFLDIKLMDAREHQRYTGQDNTLILENIVRCSAANNNIVVRVPAIAGVNATEENIGAMCHFLLEQTNIRHIELLPYHKLGYEKMQALGLHGELFATPSAQELAELTELIHSYGLTTVSYK